MFKTITERLMRLVQGFDMLFTPGASSSLNLFVLIKQAQEHVKNKHGKTPTVLLYSPTLSKLVKSIEEPLANELGILARKEPRVWHDHLMLVHNDVDVAVISRKNANFESFLDRAESQVGIVIGDVFPGGDLGEGESYDDEDTNGY